MQGNLVVSKKSTIPFCVIGAEEDNVTALTESRNASIPFPWSIFWPKPSCQRRFSKTQQEEMKYMYYKRCMLHLLPSKSQTTTYVSGLQRRNANWHMVIQCCHSESQGWRQDYRAQRRQGFICSPLGGVLRGVEWVYGLFLFPLVLGKM